MTSELTNHLWQSTLFAATAGLLTIAFRKNRARVRYWLWLSASFKFLFPLSLLMSLGSHLEWAPAAKKIGTPAISFALVQVTQPFPRASSFARPAPDRVDWVSIAIFGVWACGFLCIALIRFRGWLRIRAALRASAPIDVPATIEVRSCPGLLEPGVVGLWNPTLLLPTGILDSLTPRQFEALLAHELCHVRRRDNLLASIHMVVEATFWFHPLAWWIGTRLVEERERACDEEVLQLGGEPRAYVEAILSVCKHHLKSPLVCVSGITSSNLKKRIDAILGRRIAQNLTLSKKLLLAAAGSAAMVAPIAIGSLTAPVSGTQSTNGHPRFEVASIRPSISADRRPRVNMFDVQHGGQFTAANLTLRRLIQIAYGIKDFQISGAPGWTASDLFDIAAKPEGPTKPDQLQLMLQSLLAERFQLVIRHDAKQMPVYALVIAKGGPKFKEVHESDPNMEEPLMRGAIDRANSSGRAFPAGNRMSINIVRRGLLIAQGTNMHELAKHLSDFLGTMVADKTELTGMYDLKLEWQPDASQVAMFEAMRVPEGYGAPPPDPLGPSLFAALREQLGLKLESDKGPVETFVIEHIEKPSAN